MSTLQYKIVTFIVLLSALYGVRSASAEEYCAFEVVVKTPTDAPVSERVVSLLMDDGRTFASVRTDAKGRAKLCDAPEGLLHIQVGGRRCGAVTVGYLTRWWMRTRPVRITYLDCAGEEWAIPGQCLLTVRVRDEDGVPISGARFTPAEGKGWAFETPSSDSFGRAFADIEFDMTLQARLEVKGYQPVMVVQGCNKGQDSQKEQIVTLKRDISSEPK